MPFKLGNLSGDKIFLGNTEVTSAFLGTQQVYSSGPAAFELGTVTYDNVSFSLQSPSPQTTAGDLSFNNDGTAFYQALNGSWGSGVYQYAMSNPYDLSTASYNNKFLNVTSVLSTGLAGIRFNLNGSKMFLYGFNTDAVHEYNLSTNYDITTATYTNNSFSVASQVDLGRVLLFNLDGSKMYILRSSFSAPRNAIYQYTLSTPFSITSASYDNVSYDFGTTAFLAHVSFNNDGSKLFLDAGSSTLRQYSMSTPFDISTISNDNVTLNVGSSVRYYFWNNDGTKLFATNSSPLYQYTHTF